MHRPEGRKTLTYKVYCDIIITMKQIHSKKRTLKSLEEKYPPWLLRRVYDKFVRRSLREGANVQDLY